MAARDRDAEALRQVRHDAKNEALAYLAQAEALVAQAKSIRDRFAERIAAEETADTGDEPR